MFLVPCLLRTWGVLFWQVCKLLFLTKLRSLVFHQTGVIDLLFLKKELKFWLNCDRTRREEKLESWKSTRLSYDQTIFFFVELLNFDTMCLIVLILFFCMYTCVIRRCLTEAPTLLPEDNCCFCRGLQYGFFFSKSNLSLCLFRDRFCSGGM